MKTNNFFLKSRLEQGLYKALLRDHMYNQDENETPIRDLISRVEAAIKAGNSTNDLAKEAFEKEYIDEEIYNRIVNQ